MGSEKRRKQHLSTHRFGVASMMMEEEEKVVLKLKMDDHYMPKEGDE